MSRAEQSRAEQRNYSIDTLKFFLCFLIILIHAGDPYSTDIINRLAVPCFFIISGYFMYRSEKSEMLLKLKSAIKEILIITFWSLMLYSIISYNTLFSWLNIIALNSTVNRVIAFTLFGDPIIIGISQHLWYLFAYIYVLIFTWLLYKVNIIKYVYYLIPILITPCLFLGLYSFIIFDDLYIPVYISRNFLFVGFPFFLIGNLIRKYSVMLLKNRNIIYLPAVVCALLSAYECICINPKEIGAGVGDLYITTVPMVILLMFVALSIKQKKDNIISRFGREYSLYIYIFHIMTIEILIQFNEIIYNHWWYAISVFLVTIVISILFKKSVVPIYQSVIKKFC